MAIVLTCYCVLTVSTFCVWFKLFLEDATTAINDAQSWFMLLTASLAWPITVPLALVELLWKGNVMSRQSINQTVDPSLSHFSATGSNALPLGYILKQAGLLTDLQITTALNAQQYSPHHLKIGQVIVEQGWLQQETIDFFAEHLPQIHHFPKQPIGQYLKQAKLLDDQQIDDILAAQKQTNLRFGEIAVQKGWVKPETINLILRYVATPVGSPHRDL